MQFVIVVPELKSGARKLTRRICGVGLLERTLVTAHRAGASDILLIWPQSAPANLSDALFRSPLMRGNRIVRILHITHFDANSRWCWAEVQAHLDERFIWLPWNWVTYPRALANFSRVERAFTHWKNPTWVSKFAVVSGLNVLFQISLAPDGVSVTSGRTAAAAERFLVARSGKILDGIYTSFNRRLCWPAVRSLSHTRVTPNAVTFGGVIVAILSGIAFARGNYCSYVVGALLFFVAGLFDEMDGMLARIKFADSPFGTWLEGFADGLSYLLLFVGITIGLYRQYGVRELWFGAALLVGTVLSLVVTSLQRRRATSADRPNEYLGKLYGLLEKDSSNWISRAVRQVQAFQKRGVMIHYVVIFTVLGGLPVLFYLGVLGANLTWTLALHFNHRFFKQTAPGTLSGVRASSEA
jgi:phosphatidylglycerophosphate synthase